MLGGGDAKRFEVFESADDVSGAFVQLTECTVVGLLGIVEAFAYGLEGFDVGGEFVVELCALGNYCFEVFVLSFALPKVVDEA